MKLMVPDFWEEHCVECGAPACYGTCEKFRRAPGGVCRRIDKGRFLPWGKMELYWQGRLAGTFANRLLCASFGLVAPIVRGVFSETILRGLRRRVTARVGRRMQPNMWIIACHAETDETLFASIANREKEDLLVRRLDIKAGFNRFEISVPEKVPAPSFFRIYSIEGTRGKVTFDICAVGRAEMPRVSSASLVKCVAWDLDNTLWSGILANDGVENLKVRPGVADVIRELDRRGILNTVVSKNDFGPACAALERFGLEEYFVFPAINWNPKSENLTRIAQEMNIGLDAFALIDDSAHERGEVHENLPMVRIFDEKEVEGLLQRPELNPPVSSESASRRLSYRAEMTRRRDEADMTGSHEEFLRACEIKLKLQGLDTKEIEQRCWELVNRTNQLTLAAHRYTADEFAALVGKCDCHAIRCVDKYGDYGIVGFVAIRQDEICEFVMSCRVAKKLCEQSVLLFLADQARARGRTALYATVVPTGRNLALIEAFDAMPFAKREADGIIRYDLSLAQDWSSVFRNEVTA